MNDSEKPKDGILGEPFPNPAAEEVPYEDAMADLERQDGEERGEKSLPWKSLPFWLSFIATNLSFLAAAEILPVKIQDWVVILITTLAHLGYGVAISVFRRNQDQLHSNKPTWQRPAFYASWVASLTAYGLGSGDPTVVEYSGQVAMLLSFLGVAVRPHIQRRTMATLDDPVNLIQKLLEVVLFLSRRKLREQRSQDLFRRTDTIIESEDV